MHIQGTVFATRAGNTAKVAAGAASATGTTKVAAAVAGAL